MRRSNSIFLLYALILSIAHSLIGNAQSFEATMQKQGLVDVQKIDSSILVELKYSTTDNFVGKDVYGDLTRAYMQPMAARKLAKASQYLQEHHPNLRLLVYDAARPRQAQWNLWNALPDVPERERRKYVADPRLGSIHNYGCAVDLTVANADGKPLDMGTKYDFFGELAYPSREAALLKGGKLTKATTRQSPDFTNRHAPGRFYPNRIRVVAFQCSLAGAGQSDVSDCRMIRFNDE